MAAYAYLAATQFASSFQLAPIDRLERLHPAQDKWTLYSENLKISNENSEKGRCHARIPIIAVVYT